MKNGVIGQTRQIQCDFASGPFMVEENDMKKKQLNIAIVGLGNIGLYFYSYLKKNQSLLEKKTNSKPNIYGLSANNIRKKRKIYCKINFF